MSETQLNIQGAGNLDIRKDPRETARTVLMDILGLTMDASTEEGPALKDEDDFYFLGGDSLLAVQAVGNLEQLGFQVDLSTFYQTGNIGEILDSLIPPEDKEEAVPHLTKQLSKLSNEEELNECLGEISIELVEWNDSKENSKDYQQPTATEIKKLMTDIFEQKDPLYRTFGMVRSDLETVVASSFIPHKDSIILLAFCPFFDEDLKRTSANRKLVGAVLCHPTELVNEPTTWSPRSGLLMKYLQSTYPQPGLNGTEISSSKKRSLYMALIGVLTSMQTEHFKNSKEATETRWKRSVLEILLRMERKVLELAKAKGFDIVERINTSEITVKTSLDLGYRIVSKASLKTFAEKEQIQVDPKYLDHHSYYMVKDLNE